MCGCYFVVPGHWHDAYRHNTWTSINDQHYRSSGIQLGAGITLSIPAKAQWVPPSRLPTGPLFLANICGCSEDINSGNLVFYQHFTKEISKGTKKAACSESWCLPWYFHFSVQIVMFSSPHTLQTQEGASMSGTGIGDTLSQRRVPGMAKPQHLWGERPSGCAHTSWSDARSLEPCCSPRVKNGTGISRANSSCCLLSILAMTLQVF